MYELKIYRGTICYGNKKVQNWDRKWLVVSKLTWRLRWILTRAPKNLKNLHFNRLPLTKVYNVSANQSMEELFLMALKIDATLDWKLTCTFKTDMRNLGNFHQKTGKSKNWDFDGILLSKVENVWFWYWQRSFVSWKWKMKQNYKTNWSVSSKLHEQFDKFWHEHSQISKICTVVGFFWTKDIMFELKRYRGVMFGSTEYRCNILRKTDLCFQKWHEEL